MSDELLNEDPLIEYARVRLRDFYRSQRFRDHHRGEELFFLLFQSSLHGALIAIPFFFVLMIPPVWRLAEAAPYPRAVVVGLWLLTSSFALWMERRDWQRMRDDRVMRTATDSDYLIAVDYLWRFEPPFDLSGASGHELQVLLRMQEVAGPRIRF